MRLLACMNVCACACVHICVYWHAPCQNILCTQMYLVQKTISKYDIRPKYMLVN